MKRLVIGFMLCGVMATVSACGTNEDTLTVLEESTAELPSEEQISESFEESQVKEEEKSSETPEDFYMVATSLPASEVEGFAMDIKKNIQDSDWAALSEKISYPITMCGVVINNASDLLEMNINNTIREDFVAAIQAEECQQMFCNWQGIYMGSAGQIWIGSIVDENENSTLKIIGINEMLEESAVDTQLLERFYAKVYGEDLSAENMEGRLADRDRTNVESCYSEDMTYYWEIIRGVTDISYLTDPLYFTDMRYYSAEDFAEDTPVAIHLAKNEIYAKHGYIFKNEDLNSYFLGCAWYTPLYTGEEFDASVFNDYELKNLEILAELDANNDWTSANSATSSDDESSQNKLTVEEAWEKLKESSANLESSELEEIRYDEDGNFQAVIGRGYRPWADEEVDRLCEDIIFFDSEEDSCYLFGHYYVYYEEDEETVFTTQTKGWYEVDFYTGEVSQW